MRIFLDTAEIEQIHKAVKLGVISGVTTNPSLLAKAGRTDYKAAIIEIASIVNGSVSAEVISQDAEGMIKEGRDIASWSPYVAVKIPCTPAGIEATSVLSKEKIKVNLTLCFTVNQAIMAALAGATYVSPFIGRLDDIGTDGMEMVADVVDIYDRYDFPTQVIAASVRHPLHCVQAAKAGAHIATVPYKTLMQMIDHPLTTSGLASFLKDWEQATGKLSGEGK